MLTDNIQDALYLQLGELIRDARSKANIQQELLAEYLNLSRVSISNIENGKQKIQVHTLLEVAKYLRINVSELLEPLNPLLVTNVVSTSDEKRIIKGTEPPKPFEGSKAEETEKVKEFVNFLKVKKGE